MIWVILIGCATKRTIQTSEDGVIKALPKAEKLVLPESETTQNVDRDGDGKTDIWNYYNDGETTPYLKVLDLNRDGQPDVRSHFDSQGQLVKEEFDGDFDGTIDIEDIYQADVRIESYIDTNTDGVFDVFRYYKDGTLIAQESDSNYDGTIDQRQDFK